MSHEYHGPEPLSANAKFAAWVVGGGLMFVGFGFGLWAGTRPPEPRPREVAKAAPREETPKAVTTGKKDVAPEPKPGPTPEPPAPKPEVVAKKPEPPTPKPTEVAKKADPPKVEAKPNAPEVTFAKDLLPVIRTHCLTCHGVPKIEGGLDMRSVSAILKGGNSGDAIKPGDPSKGSLWSLVKDGEMPPAGKPKMSDAEKKLFRDWIESGAK